MKHSKSVKSELPSLGNLPTAVRVLFTAVIITLAIAMAGALVQIVLHDIIPTFFSDQTVNPRTNDEDALGSMMDKTSGERDLFSDMQKAESRKSYTPLYKTEQFVWLVKWTHIHLFGMSMIFILLGMVTVFLNTSQAKKVWLVVLPFMAVLTDIAAMWFKAYISPIFFWLHVPGGGLFVIVFLFVSVKALREMWTPMANH